MSGIIFRGFPRCNNVASKPGLVFLSSVRFFSSKNVAGPISKYMSLVSEGKIVKDSKQLSVVTHLQRLYDDLLEYEEMKKPVGAAAAAAAAPKPSQENHNHKEGSGLLSRFFGAGSKKEAPVHHHQHTHHRVANVPTGLYLYGTPGCGKTFLMDLFYDTVPFDSKRRVHFNEFMLGVHDRLHKIKKTGGSFRDSFDPIPPLAHQLACEGKLLCFDEFQVTDIADAMILKRLFTMLIDQGVVVMATSNRPPEDLYLNGLQRHLFLPFIDFIKGKCEVVNINSAQDYRYGGTRGLKTFFTPADGDLKAKMEEVFQQLTHHATVAPAVVQVMQGRVLKVPRAAQGVACFSFDELCNRPLGASDYIALAENFHSLLLTDIPKLNLERRNEVRRFILLIDELYQHKVKLVCSAEAEPKSLFSGEGQFDEVFAWDRCVSRLTEMQSTEYIQTLHPLQEQQIISHLKEEDAAGASGAK